MGKQKQTAAMARRGPDSIFLEYSKIHDLSWVKNMDYKAGNKTQPVGYFQWYKFQCECADPRYNEWISCERGAEKGQYCENPRCNRRSKTKPYEGPILCPTPYFDSEEHVSGRFECPNRKCRKTWESMVAYGGKYQACGYCYTHAYAYDMWEDDLPLPMTRGPHKINLCQKCQDDKSLCYAGLRQQREDLLEEMEKVRVEEEQKENRRKFMSVLGTGIKIGGALVVKEEKKEVSPSLLRNFEKQLRQIDAQLAQLRRDKYNRF